jgi:hypothetical protein
VNTELPPHVRRLLQNGIDTFEKLEVVVMLRAAPRSVMSVADLATGLKQERSVVRRAALELRAIALVDMTADDEIRLVAPTSRDFDSITELARLYADDRLAVVKALGEIAMQRIRNMASQAFADAFVIRKKPSGDGDG